MEMYLEKLAKTRKEIGKRIKGYEKEIDLSLIAIAALGHVLYTGVPGLAKTLLAKTIAEISGCSFRRIQLTPDLMPSSINGNEIWRPDMQRFVIRKGPIFANIVLADEINRAPPQVQSAFLEAMEERQVTIGEESLPLPEPFFVFATRNQIELGGGIYPLPVAQMDRFLFEVVLSYPTEKDEIEIAKQGNDKPIPVEKVWTPAQLMDLAQFVSKNICVNATVNEYLVRLVRVTREHKPAIELGASPRSSKMLTAACKAHAFIVGKSIAVTPEDVDAVAEPLLRPRLIRNPLKWEDWKNQELSFKELIDDIRKKAREKHLAS